MRRLCLTVVAMSAMLALPVWAQQGADGTRDGAKAPDDSTTASTADTTSTAETTNAVPPRTSFAVPDVPRATPFPGPAPSSSSGDQDTAPGRLTPKFEVAGLYSYINFNPGSGFASWNNNGEVLSFAYNPNRILGLTAEVAGYNFTRATPTGTASGGFQTWLFGPRLNLRRDHFVPFVEFLVGGFRAGPEVTGIANQQSFALAAGGGVDIVITKHIAWRFAQLDYLMTNASGTYVNSTFRQNNFRAGSGIVLRWGFPPTAPPPPSGPPTASCSANPTSVYQGSNDPVAIHVTASSPASLPLTYSYTATGGAVDGTGPDARWNSTGVAVGTYTVTSKVDDGKGGTASCTADIAVQERPHHPPSISCSANPSTVAPGEKSTITSTASSPDNLDLTYSYSATGGQVTGNGPTATFDSTGLTSGSYKVNCSVTDSRGDKADGQANVDVQQPPPPPQATKVGECGYIKPGQARFDNLCKRVGDDVALRLKSDPNAKVVIVGYADPKEPKAAKLAQSRADLAKAYLGEKGIDASRSTTRTGQASTEKGTEKENRRVEFIFVPEGATY
ncbi:MAG: OmpA family protein [Candidatus Acidiferrum sp.]|jgi:OmpA family protein